MPYGDHEGRRDEDADLTELDFFGLVVVTRGTEDDQAYVFVIALDLRPPVNDLRVLDRQFMQPEGLTYPGQLLRVGIEQPQPHEAALATPGRRLLQRHGALPRWTTTFPPPRGAQPARSAWLARLIHWPAAVNRSFPAAVNAQMAIATRQASG